MEADQKDKLLRSFARLSALKENLPKNLVPEKFAIEYHEALEHIEDLGFDVEEFKISSDQVGPRMTSFNYVTGTKHYSDARYVNRDYLMMKLSAALSFFQLSMASQQTAPPSRIIGFAGPRRG